jgi:hypothetical protein
MRLGFVLTCVVHVFLLVSYQAEAASPAKDACAFPAGLRDEISRKHPGTRVVAFDDLTEHRRRLFEKHHGSQGPGLVKVNFYGDGKPKWAVVLISGENPKRKAELVVARQADEGWETRSFDTTDGTPVGWREGPGKYEDLYGKKTIRARWPVIVFCGLESWELVFAWTGKEVESVQTSDQRPGLRLRHCGEFSQASYSKLSPLPWCAFSRYLPILLNKMSARLILPFGQD